VTPPHSPDSSDEKDKADPHGPADAGSGVTIISNEVPAEVSLLKGEPGTISQSGAEVHCGSNPQPTVERAWPVSTPGDGGRANRKLSLDRQAWGKRCHVNVFARKLSWTCWGRVARSPGSTPWIFGRTSFLVGDDLRRTWRIQTMSLSQVSGDEFFLLGARFPRIAGTSFR
jgi:hypothetical protein